ncbi:zinc metalloprotease HtpX [Candidatus Daviesbacteria bacterium RIFCSPHIGHO2_12_FULL_37_11]|uniref:Protease HtpX homolog n=1 Tax=Candidatus Daviesbacteria bacterium RIFCSPHIGHO2_12_FULL_37_11 TaxID=1797777 RepID=A0A1F5KE99_9BACT|nr:MAG: zinc metalloprotease HtpX [Candidatus Daviesbacteria bacterium GWA1_38_6]OGE18163.1 MAG: zinc metalloprotease HtpX [Candidatus Daviesbacteria bacterium RIFCSPHIGHO2_01_FULL_37_27]OGE39267.1 MAG: zinc metalloprotease HtpX [Candidatus Daviesbacteria bacterium RIFCSPHIGHO2_12_FULL_37_11]OGE45656.1 MAG: zinc metalloprotease HtpX [Candidatus Daviesbacteria bacterium RIFCSPLOWO2_01_FULL_37_10]
MFFFSLFVIAVVYIIARAWGFDGATGLSFVGMALIMTGVMNFVSYWWSDKIVLSISRAKPIQKKDNPQVYRLVENLCIASGLPLPKIYVIDDSAPNAFATGRDPKHSAIAFTSGILEKLNKQELEGVTAHELSHVGNRDTLVMTVVSVLVGTIALLADWYLRSLWFGGRDNDRDSKGNGVFMVLALVMAILAPIVATLIQLAVSRKREFLADASGVLLTRYPEGLASALRKISGDREPLEVANRGTAHLYIVNPLKGRDVAGFMANMFNTHPPIEARIKALHEMEGKI